MAAQEPRGHGGAGGGDGVRGGGVHGGDARIRDAVRADLPAILAIYNAAVPLRSATADLVPQDMPARERWWEDRDLARRPVLVAERGGRTVAWGAFTDFKPRAGYAPTAEVSVYVDPPEAGRGLGRAMLDALLARAPGCGIDRVLALCFAHNEASVRLFRSRGFAEWGRLPDACDMDGVRRTVVVLGRSVPG
jgi:phosphinothricin acetyltransferase